jgi:hypothetical protein
MTTRIDPRNIEVLDDDIAAVLREKTPAERVAMAADANETARKLVAAGIRHFHPDWSERQVEREVARRMLREAD